MAQLEFLLTCETVITAQDGRNSLINLFDRITSPTFPLIVPSLTIAGAIKNLEKRMPAQVRLQIQPPNPDSAAQINDLKLDIPKPNDKNYVNFNLVPFQLPEPGEYIFTLQLQDDDEWEPLGSISLFAMQPTIN